MEFIWRLRRMVFCRSFSFIAFVGIILLTLQQSALASHFVVQAGTGIGVKDKCNKPQKKNENKQNKRKNAKPGSSNDCHSKRNRNHSHVDITQVAYGGVIAWADRPFGGSVVAWADRPFGGSVITWAQPRCNNINIVTHSTLSSWPVIPGYWSPTETLYPSSEATTTQAQRTLAVKQRRMPSRPRSSAPHSGTVHWVNQSPQTKKTTSLADARPRVWCIKHASRTCGCYGPSPETIDHVQIASTESVQP
jgi:hypothetical protein